MHWKPVSSMLDREQVLGLSIRKTIYELIKQNPGLHFREIKRRTNLAIGALQYHLAVLEKNNFVRVEKKGKFTRYFPFSTEQSREDQSLLGFLHDSNVRRMILYLVEHGQATNKQLSEFLHLSPSTISFHLKKLITSNLLQEQSLGRETFYSLVNREQAKQLLVQYKSSFLDELVDNFVNVWQGLEIKTSETTSSMNASEITTR